ncbi:MAG: tetratricopeptide repeat protein [Pseudomonadota bacterium]
MSKNNKQKKHRKKKSAKQSYQSKKEIRQSPAIAKKIQSALMHHRAGRLKEAEQLYRKVLTKDSKNVNAHLFLGIIAHQVGKNEIAIQFIQKALSINPEYDEAHYNYGVVLQGTCRFKEAITSYKKVISINPGYAEAHNNLGVVLKETNHLKEAVTSFKNAISIRPEYAEAYNNLGVVLKQDGCLEESIVVLKKALSINGEFAEAHNNLGNAFKDSDKCDQAFACYQNAIRIDAHNNLYWANFANCLMRVNFTAFDDNLYWYLFQMLEQPAIVPSDVSKPIINALLYHPCFAKALKLSKSNTINDKLDTLLISLSEIPLLLRLLALCPIADIQVEKLLTQMRKAILNKTISIDSDIQGLPFIAALALHCFTNEFIFYEGKDEQKQVKHLQEKIKTALDNNNSISLSSLAILASYRPLNSFSWSKKLLGHHFPETIKQVISRHIVEVEEEQSIRLQIFCLSPIKDSTSCDVQKQYEENPYPCWVKTNLNPIPYTIQKIIQGINLLPKACHSTFSENPDILIAGCGTGQHSLNTASRFLNCNVLAVDLSLSSLAYAIRKTRELGVLNIEYMQGDILELNRLNRQFDIIESIGVLHHMAEPLAGWKILVNLLRSGGLMKIGLYSDIARKPIVAAREIIAQKKMDYSPASIQKFRREIIQMSSKSDEDFKQFSNWRDFYSMSNCRDLFFHVQEHRFTLPQIKTAIKDLGLEFLGFELPQETIKFNRRFRKKDAIYSLSLWHEYELENPSTFQGMYQFWVQKA